MRPPEEKPEELEFIEEEIVAAPKTIKKPLKNSKNEIVKKKPTNSIQKKSKE